MPAGQGTGQVRGDPRRHRRRRPLRDPGNAEAGATRAAGPDPAPGRGPFAFASRTGRRIRPTGPTLCRAARTVRRSGPAGIRAIVKEAETRSRRRPASRSPWPQTTPSTEATVLKVVESPGIPGDQGESRTGGRDARAARDPSHRGGSPDRGPAGGVPRDARPALRPGQVRSEDREERRRRLEKVATALGLGGLAVQRSGLRCQGGPTEPMSAESDTRTSFSTRPTTTSTPPAADTSRSPT